MAGSAGDAVQVLAALDLGGISLGPLLRRKRLVAPTAAAALTLTGPHLRRTLSRQPGGDTREHDQNSGSQTALGSHQLTSAGLSTETNQARSFL
jgi:hypothetical protein